MGPTLSAVLDDARRRGLVGRAPELESFQAALSGTDHARVLFVHGPGGIGKSTLVVDSVPVVTGLVAVGDAAASTNPSLGRGASIGAVHACVLRDVVAKEGPSDPETLVLRFAAETGATVAPYLDSTLAYDRHRLAEIDADVAGVPYEPADPAWAMTRALGAGAREDPVLARALATIAAMLATPGELLSDPELSRRVARFVGWSHYSPGARRAELLAAVRAAQG